MIFAADLTPARLKPRNGSGRPTLTKGNFFFMKKLQVTWPLWFSITLIAGMWVGYTLKKKIPDSQGFWEKPRNASVQEVVELLQKRYVDPVATDSLTETAIAGMLDNLDPHTVYIPAALTAAANEDIAGNFEGIGVEFFIIDDTVNAFRIIPGGPSEKAGLQTGDKFLKVGDSVVAGTGITNESIKKLLRGESGSKVEVSLLREGKTVKANITRGTIPKPAVDAALMIDPTIGFIHLNKFSKSSYVEFMQSLEALQKKGMQQLILDLRGNGGGILDEAVQIADEFLEEDRLILYTEGSHSPRQEFRGRRPGLFEKGPLVILTDEFSASAAEVLAGALQDWDRATLVGRRTFGKGLVQEPFELSNGAQLRLTVARYYTPSGRNIQKPYSQGLEEYHEEVYHRNDPGVTRTLDSAVSQEKPYKTLLKKRVVYGGGGIVPDQVVAADSFRLAPVFRDLYNTQSLSRFVLNYYVKERAFFGKYPSAVAFSKDYQISAGTWQDFLNFTRKDSVLLTNLSPRETEMLQQQIKTQLALQIWGTPGSYEISKNYDPVLLKAIALLRVK